MPNPFVPEEILYPTISGIQYIKKAVRFSAVLLCLIMIPAWSWATSPLCPTNAFSQFEYISSVTLNGLTVPCKTSTSGSGYLDLSNTSLGNFQKGKTYPISITVFTDYNYDEYVRAWFDFNGNNSLTDPGELVFDTHLSFSGSNTFTSTITIPENALSGEMYFRVGLHFSRPPFECNDGNSANAADFKINIIKSGEISPKSVNSCVGGVEPKLTFNTDFGASFAGPYTFTYQINGGPNQTISTTGNDRSVEISVPTNLATTFIYKLVSVYAAGDTTYLLNDSATISVHAVPSIPLITSSGSSICDGQKVVLTSSEGVAYTWSTGATTRSISIDQVGDYSVIVSNAFGCSNASVPFHQGTITVLEAPIVGPYQFLCLGDSVTLNATGPNSSNYVWSPSNGLNKTTGASVIANPTHSTDYTITAPNGCSSSISVYVIPKPDFVITPSGSTALCTGNSIDLSVPADGFFWTGYQWSSGATNSSIHVSNPGVYSVTIGNAYGCYKTNSIAITNGVQPVASGGNYVNLCLGSSTTINVSGASGYTWSPSFGLNTTTGASVIANPTSSTTYTVTSTDPGNCSTNLSINVNPHISIQANGPTTFCSGDSVLLSAGDDLISGNALELDGASVYLRTPNLSPSIPSSSLTLELWFKPVQEGIIVSELGQASLNVGFHNSQIEILANGLVKVRVWDLAPIAVGTASFNTWQHVVLRYDNTTGILNGWLNGTKSGASSSGIRQAPGPQYWAFGAGDVQHLGSGGAYFKGLFDEIRIWNIARTDNEIGQNYNRLVPPSSQGLIANYKLNESSGLTAIDATGNGNNGTIFNISSRAISDIKFAGFLWSTGATTQSIKVKTGGNYTLSYSFFDGCASSASQLVTVLNKPIISGNDTVDICLGSSTTLNVTGATGYIWSPAYGLNTTSGSTVIASPLASTTYTVTSTGPGSCATIIRVNVNAVPATPTISVNGPTTFCKGDSVILSATGASNYLWSTGETTASIKVKLKGIYSVTTSNVSGCTATASIQVNVGDVPRVTGNNNNIPVCVGTPVTLTASGAYHYIWSSNVSLNQDSTIGIVSPLGTETYTVWSNDGIYCSTSITVPVNQLPEPTISVSGPVAFCDGGSTQLSTETYSKYVWSNGDTTRVITATKEGNYSVTVTNANGCIGTSAPFHVTVYQAPGRISIMASDTIICEGASVTLTPSGGIQYFWVGVGDVGLTYMVSPTSTKKYIVYAYNAIGCYKTDSITIHVNASTIYYQDLDGDGFGNANVSNTSCTLLAGWVIDNTDCDDMNKDKHRGAAELCDGVDNDCDGQIDEDVTHVYYLDADKDGFGNPSQSIMSCTLPEGYVNNNGDCNDGDSLVHQTTMYYLDNDGDGFGGTIGQLFCLASPPSGYSIYNSDCFDQNNTIYPGATELCDGLDNNCNGQIDEGLVHTLYLDNDGDGYGNPGFSIQSCYAIPGYVLNNTDCNDADANIHPGAIEICDGKDNNCDGKTDDVATAATYYPDRDGDGFGDSKNPGVSSCITIPGSVTNNGDCNDSDRSIHQAVFYYLDNDHDGHGGQIGVMQCSSSAPGGFSTTNDDCDDVNPAVPALLYMDADGDGYGTGNVIIYCSKDKPIGYSPNNTDCNDADGSVHQQTMYYVDADGDGFGSTTGQLFCLSSPPAGYSRNNSDCDDHNAQEQCCVFTNSMSFSQSPYNGNDCYSLTGRQDQAGAIWGNESISLNHDFSFEFNTSQTSGSQGMMFVLQTTGINAIGASSAAGTLGYYNSPDFTQSIGIELDNANSGGTYNDLSAAHVAIVKNGNPSPVAGVYDLGSSFSDVVKNLKINWNHTTHILSVYLDGALILTYNKDLVSDVFAGSASVYFGFTSSNEPSADPKAKPASQEFCVNRLIYDNGLKIIQSGDFICNSLQLMTNAVASCTFHWSTGATTPAIQITQSGSYSVTVTNAEGCVTIVSYNAVVTSGPVITASATQLCPGAFITLTSSIANSYLWSTNETTRSILVDKPGEYSVSSGGCIAYQSITTGALPKPSIRGARSDTICEGSQVALVAEPGFEAYTWMRGGNIIAGVIKDTLHVTETGAYSVMVSNGDCVSENSEPVIVTVSAPKFYYKDADGDGYGNPQIILSACIAPQGFVTNHTDCDDSKLSIHPGAIEICDGTDNNCDGNVNEGLSIPATPIVNLIQPTCVVPTGTIVIANKLAVDSASFNNGLSYQISNSKSGLSPGNYMIRVKTVQGCLSVAFPVTLNVNSSIPSTPAISIIQPTCLIPTGTISINNKVVTDSASFDTGLSYRISPVKSGLSPGTYVVRIKNIEGCISIGVNAIIDPIPFTPETPIINISQPSCSVLSGSVEVTNKAKNDSVSFNNGLLYQISNTKTGLLPGNYLVKIKSVQGCLSNAIQVQINDIPTVPSYPIVNSIQPTCQFPGGSIEITNKAIKDSASFNNGQSYQISNVKSGLTPGQYMVMVKNIEGCISGSFPVSISSLSSIPAAPKSTIIDPTCFILTGTITINNKAAKDSASFDNGISYQISNVKSGMPPGNYSLRIKNVGGCISNSVNEVIGPVKNNPELPILNITQPSCSILSGTIEVTNKAEKDSVSFNNGVNYQISNTKSGLSAGNYMIIIKTAAGCLSGSKQAIINSAPNVPAAPLFQIVQPTCYNPTGIIVITNKSSLDSVSFNDGLTYQILMIVTGLTPGTYTIKIKNLNGCISGSTKAVIIPASGTTTAPLLNIIQPTCTNSKGTITITNKIITDSASFDNGLTYQKGNSKSNLSPGNYQVKLKSSAGCTSPSTAGTINLYIPLKLSISNLDTAYYRNTLAFKMTGNPAGGIFKIDGSIPSQDRIDPTTLALGNHTVSYTVTKDGCISTHTRQVRIKTIILEGEGSQCYTIQDSLNPTRYAGIANGSISNNTALIQQVYLDSAYQKLIVTDINGYKRIRNKKSGLYLKVLNNGNVVQGAWDTISAEWALVPNDRMNSFSLFSRSKEKYLTLGNNNNYTLATISGSTRPGSNQMFNFIRVNCAAILRLTSDAEVLEQRENADQPGDPISLDLYPNPNQGLFTLRFYHLDLNQKALLTIYTILGQKVWEQNIEHNNPVKIQLIGNVITNGMYVAKLKSGNNVILKNFLIRN